MTTNKFCVHCGNAIDSPAYVHCPSCGKATSASQSSLVRLEKPARWKKALWAAIVIACVLTAAGLGWFARHHRPQSVATILESPQIKATSDSKPSPDANAAATPSRVLTAGDLYKQSSPGVVKITVYDDDGKAFALGSGFVVGPTGQIATNYHVIRGATRGVVHFNSGAEVDITGVLGVDRSHDVALLKAAEPYCKPLPLATQGGAHVGDTVFALGSPVGLDDSLSQGLISGFRGKLIQITAPISHGSSGGPVFDQTGNVIGLSTAMLVGNGMENLNFAVPVSFLEPYLSNQSVRPLKELAADSATHTVLFHGYIGLSPRDKKVIPFLVNPNTMANATLEGNYQSKGGLGGNVHMVLVKNGKLAKDYGEDTDRQVKEKLGPGSYALVIFSDRAVLFTRDVDADFSLNYVQ